MGDTEKRGIVIHFWNSKFFHCGHASLEISEDCYISFWQLSPCWKILVFFGLNPLKTRFGFLLIDYLISFLFPFVNNKTHTSTYKQDAKIIGREADRHISLHGNYLNLEQLNSWWRKQYRFSYGLATRNCCTVVFNALKFCGFTEFEQDPGFAVWTLDRLYNWCEKLQWGLYQERNKNMKTGFVYSTKVQTDFSYILNALQEEASNIRHAKDQAKERRKEKDNVEKENEEGESKKDLSDDNLVRTEISVNETKKKAKKSRKKTRKSLKSKAENT